MITTYLGSLKNESHHLPDLVSAFELCKSESSLKCFYAMELDRWKGPELFETSFLKSLCSTDVDSYDVMDFIIDDPKFHLLNKTFAIGAAAEALQPFSNGITMTTYCKNVDSCCYFNVIFYFFRNVQRISSVVDSNKLQGQLKLLWKAYVPHHEGEERFGKGCGEQKMKSYMRSLMKTALKELFFEEECGQQDAMDFFTSSLQPLMPFEKDPPKKKGRRKAPYNPWFGETGIPDLFKVIFHHWSTIEYAFTEF